MAGMTVQLILQAIDKATAPIAAVGRALDKVGQAPRAVAAALGRIGQEVGLANVAARANVATQALGNVAGAAGAAALKLAAIAGVGGGGLLGLARGTANYSEQILMLSEKTGIATDRFQALAFAAEQSSVGPESFADAMKFLNANITEALQGNADAKQWFEAAGVSINDASGKAKTADVIFLEMADAFQKSGNAAAKVKIAMGTLGRAGVDMIPLLNGGSAAIEDLMGKAKSLGLILDGDAIKQAEAFGDKLSQLWQIVKATGIAIGAALIPHLEPLIDRFVDLAAELKPVVAARIGEWFQSLGDVVPVVIDGLARFWDVLQQVGSAIAWVGDTFGYGTTVAVALGAMIAGPLVLAFANLTIAATLLGTSLGGVFAKLGAAAVMPAVAAFGALFTAVRTGTGIMAAFNIVLAANPVGLIVLGVVALGAAIAAAVIYWDPMMDAIAKVGDAIKQGLGAAFDWIGAKIDFVVGGATRALGAIVSVLPDGVRQALGFAAPAAAAAAAATGGVASGGASAALSRQAPAQALSAGAARGATTQAVDGQIVIRLEGETQRARVEAMRSTGAVGMELDLGPTMVAP